MRNTFYLVAACILLLCSLSYCLQSSRRQNLSDHITDNIPDHPLPKKIAHGEKLFKDLCSKCHDPVRTIEADLVRGATDRHDIQWLRKFTRDNTKLRASGDHYAIAIYEQFNRTPMPSFPQLSDQDIDDLYGYIDNFSIPK